MVNKFLRYAKIIQPLEEVPNIELLRFVPTVIGFRVLKETPQGIVLG